MKSRTLSRCVNALMIGSRQEQSPLRLLDDAVLEKIARYAFSSIHRICYPSPCIVCKQIRTDDYIPWYRCPHKIRIIDIDGRYPMKVDAVIHACCYPANYGITMVCAVCQQRPKHWRPLTERGCFIRVGIRLFMVCTSCWQMCLLEMAKCYQCGKSIIECYCPYAVVVFDYI
jgi:hypothetical protein